MEIFQEKRCNPRVFKKAWVLLLSAALFFVAIAEMPPFTSHRAGQAFASPKALKAKESLETPKPVAKALVDVTVLTRTDGVEVNIKTDGVVSDYESFPLEGPPRLVLDLPKMLNIFAKKNIEVGNAYLKDIRIGQHPEKTRLVFTFPGTTFPSCQLSKEGQGLKLMVTPARRELPRVEKPAASESRPPNGIEEKKPKATPPAPEVPTPPTKETPFVQAKTPPPPPHASDPPGKVSREAPPKEYRGEKISLDLRDADIQTVFRMISQVSNRKIVTGPDIQDKITIRLINVPWDQALDIILAHKNWVKTEEGNIIRVTTP